MLMIMKSNSKKCSTMRKFITTMLIAAAAFTACVQNDEVVVPNNNDKITFTATVTAPQTRTVLVEEGGKFHAEWQNDDVIEVFEVTDVAQSGTKKYQSNLTTVVVNGTNSTANVELNVFDTATSYSYVLTTTNASMNGAATYLGLTLPSAQAPAAMNTFDGASDIIVSERVQRTSQPAAGETISFDNIRISAIVKVTIKNLALAAGDKVESVTFSCNKEIAGKFTKIYLDDIENGTPFAQSSGDGTSGNVTVTLPEAQSGDFSYYMNVWPETLEAGSDYSVTVITTNSKFIKKGTIPADKPLTFAMGDITSLTVNMATAEEDIVASSDYITIAGVKWATGNLWYDEDGTTEDGFVNGWSIAPNQHYCIVNSTDGPTTRDVFNFGGITDPMSHSTCVNITTIPDEGFNISGKMFTDATCATTTTNYAEAVYGDIAYYASKGKYRMPTAQEFKDMIAATSSTLATFNDIPGVYFWIPAADEERTVANNSTSITLTKDKLATGLFFPAIGRGFNKEDWSINGVGSTYMYRAADVESEDNWGDSPGETCYGVIANLKLAGSTDTAVNKKDVHYWNKAIGAKARLPIRPVVNE